MRIEIDNAGYPTEASLRELQTLNDVGETLEAVAGYLNGCGYGRAWLVDNKWHFAAGGWSGCEEVIDSIPPVVHALAWESSHRGGLHIFKSGVE